MNESPKIRLDNILLVVLRHGVLGWLGGWLIAKGWVDTSAWEVIAGFIMSVSSVWWGVFCGNKDAMPHRISRRLKVQSAIRHTLTTGGGVMVGLNLIEQSTLDTWLPSALALAASVHSYFSPEKVYPAEVVGRKLPGGPLLVALLILPALPSCEGIQIEGVSREVVPQEAEGRTVEVIVTSEVYGFAGVKILGFPVVPGFAVPKRVNPDPKPLVIVPQK